MNNLLIFAIVVVACLVARHWPPPDDWNDHDED